jgi:uncharacterized protein (TIGR00251 family)
VTLSIRVTPRASKNEIVQVLENGTIKVRLTAPPVEGKANAALIRFLAEVLEISPSQIQIRSGKSGRDKQVNVVGIDPEAAYQRLSKL